MGNYNSRLKIDSKSCKIDEINNHTPIRNVIALFGIGQCGKSTIRKQIQLISGTSWDTNERLGYAFSLWINIAESIKNLCQICDKLNLQDSLTAKDDYEMFSQFVVNEVQNGISPEFINSAKNLWNDPIIQQIWNRRSEFQVIESIEYMMNEIDRVSARDYVPTENDILRIRIRTSGVVILNINVNGIPMEVMDTGGERSERRKWANIFEIVAAIIYVTAVSEFDQSIFEDQKTNRMFESLQVFENICNEPMFTDIPIFIFMNKRDLFQKKVQIRNISDIPEFADYSGEVGSYEDGMRYFVDKFRQANKNPNKEIYIHETCALDRDEINVVFNACKTVIQNNNLIYSQFT